MIISRLLTSPTPMSIISIMDLTSIISLIIGIASFVASIVIYCLSTNQSNKIEKTAQRIEESIKASLQQVVDSSIKILNSRPEIITAENTKAVQASLMEKQKLLNFAVNELIKNLSVQDLSDERFTLLVSTIERLAKDEPPSPDLVRSLNSKYENT